MIKYKNLKVNFKETYNLDNVVSLNTKMSSRRLKFKLAAPMSYKTEEREIDPNCNTLQQDRKYYMECTIVRIMKARKVMQHSALIDEVIIKKQCLYTSSTGPKKILR